MRSTITTLALFASLSLGLAACSAEEPAPDDSAPEVEAAACACDAGKAGEAVWCGDCGKGYVDGEVATKCEGCFTQKTGGAECEACAKK